MQTGLIAHMMSVAEAAKLLGMSSWRLRYILKREGIAVRVGGRLYIYKRDFIDRYGDLLKRVGVDLESL